MTLTKSDPERIYTQKELQVFDLLEHPVWVFDIHNCGMWFGNEAALRIWNAATLEELLARDLKSDMSEPTKRELQESFLPRLERAEVVKIMRTFYPNGKPVTLRITNSAIRIDGGRTAVLAEAELPVTDIDYAAVRGNEMLRLLPLSVCQFTMQGAIEYQNPEACHVFGAAQAPKGEVQSSSSSSDGSNISTCTRSDFLNRFVDREVGKSALCQVQAGNDYQVEAECYTQDGSSRWFSLAIRRTKDPVSAQYVILYSARDITEIIQARKDTSQANLKSEFMSVIAHELRTPLHQIVGYLDLLEQTELSQSQRETVLEIQSSGQLLLIIINDLLDYSKLEQGKLEMEMVSFALDGVHDGCMAAMATASDKKNLTVTKYSAPDLPKKLLGDPIRIRQVLLNLLSNSIKFTPSGGQITISTTIVPTTDIVPAMEQIVRIRFEVTDTGIGISPDHQAKLFQKYQQANASVARNYGGTGLGLAICKGLVDAMGGTIGLTSKLDQGTTVFFEIPFAVPTSTTTGNPCSKLNRTVGPSTAEQENVVKLKILLVEDNKINQKLATRMLEKFGHTVTVAENGQIAVDELRRDCHYDLALVDVMMPVMDGVECTKQIRNALKICKEQLPIVGLTASFQHSDLDYYKNLGMNECIGKPLRMADLKKAIAAFTKQPGGTKQTLIDQ